MRIVDTHIHLDVYPVDGIPAGVADALDYRAWVPGCDPDDILACIERFHDDERIVIGASLHPWELPDDPTELDIKVARIEQIARSPRVAFVGETGLDRLKIPPDSPKFPAAQGVFERHIQLSVALDLPLVIHCVRMHALASEIVRRVAGTRSRGVVHAFAGSLEDAAQWRRLGFVVGIGPVVARSPRLRDVVARLPDDGWVLETDAPHMALAGHRGDGTPDDLLSVASLVAQARGVSVELIHGLNHSTARSILGRDL